METWYKKQPYFSEDRLSKIKDWMTVKVFELSELLFESDKVS
jgi:hypothetical protein